MSLWTFLALIIIVPAVFSMWVDYKKSLLKHRQNVDGNLDELNKEISGLKKRIQNLEAIAVNETDHSAEREMYKSSSGYRAYSDQEESGETAETNQRLVNQLAQSRRKTS